MKEDVDVMLINPDMMGLSKTKVEALLRQRIEFGNRLFKNSGLTIQRNLSGVDHLHADVEFKGLYMETSELAIVSAGMEPIFKTVGFSDVNLATKIKAWLKESPDHYKVIMLPKTNNSLECGMTYYTEESAFSILYMAETGKCASKWLLPHELGHQDGLVHESSEGGPTGGACDGVPSLMSQGLNGERDFLFGDPKVCGEKYDEEITTAYDFYSDESKYNKSRVYEPTPNVTSQTQPIILTEIYEHEYGHLDLKLVIYNPYSRAFEGQLRIVDMGAPEFSKSKAVVLKDPIYAKPKGVTTYQKSIDTKELLGYTAKLKFQADITWR